MWQASNKRPVQLMGENAWFIPDLRKLNVDSDIIKEIDEVHFEGLTYYELVWQQNYDFFPNVLKKALSTCNKMVSKIIIR